MQIIDLAVVCSDEMIYRLSTTEVMAPRHRWSSSLGEVLSSACSRLLSSMIFQQWFSMVTVFSAYTLATCFDKMVSMWLSQPLLALLLRFSVVTSERVVDPRWEHSRMNVIKNNSQTTLITLTSSRCTLIWCIVSIKKKLATFAYPMKFQWFRWLFHSFINQI